MILILDTDHPTAIQRRSEPAFSRLHSRLQSFSSENVCTTIISFEEQMRGWMSFIARSNNAQQEIVVYKRLRALLSFFNEITVMDYDEEAADWFDRLRGSKLRVGTMDLKIAAIALSKDALLLSANLKDFQKVPDLQVENWMQ